MATITHKFRLGSYLKLVSRLPLIPIESEAQLDKAIAVINDLLDKERSLEEELYLDVLAYLVKQFEDKAYPEEPVSDSAMLAELIHARGMTQAAFARKARIAESTLSAILNGSRKLTRAQIGRIGAAFKVSPDLFEFGA